MAESPLTWPASRYSMSQAEWETLTGTYRGFESLRNSGSPLTREAYIRTQGLEPLLEGMDDWEDFWDHERGRWSYDRKKLPAEIEVSLPTVFQINPGRWDVLPEAERLAYLVVEGKVPPEYA